MIKAEIVGHSLSPQGDELISVLATFPRIILAEVNTHRMLSKNTSSSRAIPFKKMLEAIDSNPFIPIAWQKHHSGMQGSEYKTGDSEIKLAESKWLEARDNAVNSAILLTTSDCVTKQLCNRLLEPFMWTTMLITGSKEGWDNFFELRNPLYEYKLGAETYYFKSWKELVSFIKSTTDNKDYIKSWENETAIGKLQHNKGQAEIHMMALAESIYDAVNESTPKQLEPGDWHIPFEDKFDNYTLLNETNDSNKLTNLKVKVSVAMAARTSYTIVGEEKGLNYENLIGLHNRLLTQDPPHSSPMEHSARAMSEDEWYQSVKGNRFNNSELHNYNYGWCYNLKGFIPYRYFVDNGLVI